MADRIRALRERYHKLYELPAEEFDKVFRFVARTGARLGEFRSREESLSKLNRWFKKH